MFTKQMQGWRNGSVGKGFAGQEWRLEFFSRNHIKLDAIKCAYNAGTPTTRQGVEIESLEPPRPARLVEGKDQGIQGCPQPHAFLALAQPH